MPSATFHLRDGQTRTVPGQVGASLMETAVNNDVAGILGECGGCQSCGTCHVYVDPDWIGRVGPATDAERQLIEFSGLAEETSRLACQIKLTDALDGLVVTVADNQV